MSINSEWNFTAGVIAKAQELGIGDRVAIHWSEAECPDQEGTVVGVCIERRGAVNFTVHIDGDISPTDGFYIDISGHDSGSIRPLASQALRSQGEAEPVAWGWENGAGINAATTVKTDAERWASQHGGKPIPLYTHPAPQEAGDVKVTEALAYAAKGLDMIHNGLMDPTRPRQAVGEVCAHFLEKTQAAISTLTEGSSR